MSEKLEFEMGSERVVIKSKELFLHIELPSSTVDA
jgi:hypothetical protein